MKLETRHVVFLPTFAWFWQTSLKFVGRANTVQLLDTALVIEGNRQTIGFPVFDFLFKAALSEWTTVTVPYSRIVKCKFTRLWILRVLLIAVIWMPLLIVFIGAFGAAGPGYYEALMLVLFGAGFGGVMLYVWMRMLAARFVLVYRAPNGRRMRTAFRVRPRAVRRAFAERLEANRKAVAALGPQAEEARYVRA